MVSFKSLFKMVCEAYTGRSLKFSLGYALGMYPANVTNMYLNGESAEYIIAASLAIQQIGE